MNETQLEQTEEQDTACTHCNGTGCKACDPRHVLTADEIRRFVPGQVIGFPDDPQAWEWDARCPEEQGWYWAVPMMPEDANPAVICVWRDDMYWSFGEQGRDWDFYRAHGPLIPSPSTDGLRR